MDGQFQIVKRDTIPPLREVEQDGEIHKLGELRDFRWSQELKDFLANASGFSVSWVVLGHEEVLDPHAHPILSMMVVYSGTGQMLGDLECPLQQGEVVVVPAGCQHGFVGGPEGLAALSIQFGEGLYTTPEKPRVVFMEGERHTLGNLLEYNERRRKEFANHPVFDLVRDGTLDDPERCSVFAASGNLMLAGMSRLLVSQRATSRNPAYQSWLVSRLQVQARTSQSKSQLRDTLLDAALTWFDHQMFVLDDAEKAAITCLVVDGALDIYREKVRLALEPAPDGSLSERASRGTVAAMELLRSESPRTYARLERIIGEGWDMMGAIAERITYLTRSSER
jgi:mannose-6-phosphate isomerase-like protein (cupin superfamily)